MASSSAQPAQISDDMTVMLASSRMLAAEKDREDKLLKLMPPVVAR